MGGVFSTDCQHGTLDVTKWYQTSRQCKSASSTHEIRASRGTETLETAKADNNCNIQHAPASCWGLWKTGTDTPIYCLENQFAVLPEPLSDSFPQQVWFAGACADGCSTFCPEEVAVAAPVCNWDGPLKGEISPEGSRGIGGGGEALSGELELEDAKLACEADVTCTGVDSTWYIGTPFVARKVRAPPERAKRARKRAGDANDRRNNPSSRGAPRHPLSFVLRSLPPPTPHPPPHPSLTLLCRAHSRRTDPRTG
jgi:hypothetical protein